MALDSCKEWNVDNKLIYLAMYLKDCGLFLLTSSDVNCFERHSVCTAVNRARLIASHGQITRSYAQHVDSREMPGVSHVLRIQALITKVFVALISDIFEKLASSSLPPHRRLRFGHIFVIIKC